MNLLYEITHCSNVDGCYYRNFEGHPCSKIVFVQKNTKFKEFQFPEPWNGDLDKAPLLFISSNPGFSEKEEYPDSSWSNDLIADFFINRFDGKQKMWVQNKLYPLLKDGKYKKNWVRFWASINKMASKLLDKTAIPGIDYAITEVVHCKSKKEIGVKEALKECTGRYLDRILSQSGASVLICLGKIAKNVICSKYSILPSSNTYGPTIIGNKERYLFFVPHPNSRKVHTLDKCISSDYIDTLRQFLCK